MTDYVVLFPADDEAAWLSGSEADHQATYDTDAEFARLLAAAGGAITGGAGLGPSSATRTLRRTDEGVAVTDGPYARPSSRCRGSSSSPATTRTPSSRPRACSRGRTPWSRSGPSRTERRHGAGTMSRIRKLTCLTVCVTCGPPTRWPSKRPHAFAVGKYSSYSSLVRPAE